MENVSVLTVDCGTQSVRGMVFDAKGKIVWKLSCKVPEYKHPYLDWVECDPEEFKNLIVNICRQLREDKPEIFRGLKAITISCMRECITVVDKDGKALRPMIIWMDRRRSEVVHPGKTLMGLFKLIGKDRMIM